MVNDALPENLTLLKSLFHRQYLVDGNELIEENLDFNGKPFKMKITLKASKGLSFVIFKFESEKLDIFPYFGEVAGLKSMCDYVVFVEDAKFLYAFLFELKKTTNSAMPQLNISETFVNFVLERFKVIGKKFDKPFEIRKVAIKQYRSNKQTTQGYKERKFKENGYVLLPFTESIRLLHLTQFETS